MITRRDWRDDEKTPVTQQTPDETRDRTRRAPQDTMRRALHEESAVHDQRAEEGSSGLAVIG